MFDNEEEFVPEGKQAVVLYHVRYNWRAEGGGRYEVEKLTVVETPKQYRHYVKTKSGRGRPRFDIIEKDNPLYQTDPVKAVQVAINDANLAIQSAEESLKRTTERWARLQNLLASIQPAPESGER